MSDLSTTSNNKHIYWKRLWFPKVAAMYREQRAEASEGWSVRAIDCVADFKEWAGKLRFATYDYAKAPEVIIRDILKESLGPPCPD